ncbi:MAG: alpha/beta fold hydrolase [Myxococcota bacterium]
MRSLLTGLTLLSTVTLGGATLALGGALATPVPSTANAKDVFEFAEMESVDADAMPDMQQYVGRDGTPMPVRIYPSESDRLVVFVHGSSYHGAAYHRLAEHLSRSGAATVVMPNLRGHHLAGRDRGDLAYVGQLEDDLADLIAGLRSRGMDGEVVLAGHSSGGGLAIRFAGGPHGQLANRVAVLAPMIPSSASIRDGDAGGWARVNHPRYLALTALNLVGFEGLNALPVIAFSKPASLWDGTETLVYSYRLNESFHPRYDYASDLAALPAGSLVMVGEHDQAIDPTELERIVGESATGTDVRILSGVDHFGIFQDAGVFATMERWLGEPA